MEEKRKWRQMGSLIAVAALSIVMDRTVLYWWGEDLPVPDNMGTVSKGAPAMRHNIQSGATYVFEETDRGESVDFTHPASTVLKDFKQGYFVDVVNRSDSGPVTIRGLIGGNPILNVPPGYVCTLARQGDGYEILFMGKAR